MTLAAWSTRICFSIAGAAYRGWAAAGANESSIRFAVCPAVAPFSCCHCLAQEEFDLRIDTAQIIGRPFFQVFPQVGRDPQQECLAL
jgi:hypothetical protein